MTFLYIFLIIFAIISIFVAFYGRKKINECENEDERKLVKARWQLISGLFGMACMIAVAVLIFTMF